MTYDKIIIGAGMYGLYAARHCARKGESVLLLETDAVAFSRATTINQARVHMGYHYPRSLSTAKRSAGYFARFANDFKDCIKADFEKIYATSAAFSWTNAKAFGQFCKAADIHCEEISVKKYFKDGMCDGAFIAAEYTYDALRMRKKMLDDLMILPSAQLRYSNGVKDIQQSGAVYEITTEKGEVETAHYVLNASYASINSINSMLGFKPFNIKYELCELILCEVNDKLKNVGITVMDGPFFSIMPFGKSGLHSLTSVTFTPHVACSEVLPKFACQKKNPKCTPLALANCNDCPAKPKTAWASMSQLAKKYLRDEFGFSYKGSLFSIKPILKSSEIDDSRPTLVRVMNDEPKFVSVLSGKINTVYDLEEVL